MRRYELAGIEVGGHWFYGSPPSGSLISTHNPTHFWSHWAASRNGCIFTTTDLTSARSSNTGRGWRRRSKERGQFRHCQSRMMSVPTTGCLLCSRARAAAASKTTWRLRYRRFLPTRISSDPYIALFDSFREEVLSEVISSEPTGAAPSRPYRAIWAWELPATSSLAILGLLKGKARALPERTAL